MSPKFKFALREDLKDKKEFLPTRGEPKASGWDVRATEDLIIKPFEYVKIRLGFRALCPEGWWFEMRPRSSTFAKKHSHALYGVVDETYEGEAIFACQYIPHMQHYQFGMITGDMIESMWKTYFHNELRINAGDAVGQIIPVQRQEMEVIDATNAEIEEEYKARAASRGDGGFGSTGK